ncbi:Haloacid dehalogenase-like hydrolase domain protein, partial [mine drainage metagenome]
MDVGHESDWHYTPFDPSTKRSEATVTSGGSASRSVKGAPAQVSGLTTGWADLDAAVAALAVGGRRVLAVAAGPSTGLLEPIGLLAFEDPVRPDARELVDRLRSLGVRVVMVTGDGI